MRSASPTPAPAGLLDLLTLDRLLTGSLIHLIYWAGLGLIAIAGFGAVGGTVGVMLRESGVGALLSVVFLVVGLLVLLTLAVMWRGVCEFFVAVFQISDDLRAIRGQFERAAAAERTQAAG